MVRRRIHLAVLAIVFLGAVGAWALRARGRQGRGAPAEAVATLEAAIADVEAGRKTTPLISGPTSTGDFTVTFLAKSTRGQVPRVVSDATGWGENIADTTFDFTIGRMKRVGRTEWYSLETRVAPARGSSTSSFTATTIVWIPATHGDRISTPVVRHPSS
jgi:hypothetical protein